MRHTLMMALLFCLGSAAWGMVQLSGGEFDMGDHFAEGGSNERPVHAVTVSPFLIAEQETTNEQFCAFLNGALTDGQVEVSDGVVYLTGTTLVVCETVGASDSSGISYAGGVFSIVAGRDDQPMVDVSWYGAAAYCNWRSVEDGLDSCYDEQTWACDWSKEGYRLPTEAEWEYAARGGLAGNRYATGNSLSGAEANFLNSGDPCEASDPATMPVGSYGANGYGLYDTAGNVWEWCNDWYGQGYYGVSAAVDPTGPVSGSYRVLRGGGWSGGVFRCRVADRSWAPTGFGAGIHGFRVCRSRSVSLEVTAGASGSVTTPGEGLFSYRYGTNVSLTAAADAFHHFVTWTGTAVDAGKVADPNSANTSVLVDDDYTLTATFAIDMRTLVLSSSAGGEVTSPGEGSWQYAHGTQVAVAATAAPNHHFVTWTGTAVDAGKLVNANSASTTILMHGDYTLVAVFEIDTHALTVGSDAGGSVTVPGEGVFEYDHGTVVPITAAAAANYHFVSWAGTAVDAGKVGDPGAAATTVAVDADYTLTATFAIDRHTLTTSSNAGGAVATPGEGALDYDYGTPVQVTALPVANYHFVSWTGTAVDAGKVGDPGAATTTVSIEADYTLKANFEIDRRTLTTSSGGGGSVTAPGEGDYVYDHGSTVALNAAAAMNYHFVSWTGTAVDAGKVGNPDSAGTMATVDGDYTVRANFAIDRHVLTTASTSGGSVSSPGEGAFEYDYGTGANVAALPMTDYHFVNWTGTAVDAGRVNDPDSADVTVDMEGNYTLTANFAIDQRVLSISSNAGGVVTNPGEGTFSYDHGTTVEVGATADGAYAFVQWSGDISSTANPLMVTMDADCALVAEFLPVVPDVVGMSRDDAESAIAAVDSLTAEVGISYSDTVASGLVVSQNPVGGTVVAEGSVIEVTVSIGQLPGYIYVDDDAIDDPGPWDPNVSDPQEDGTAEHPFDMIQEAIDVSQDGVSVIVLEGLYGENIDFGGRDITVRGGDPDDANAVANTTIDGSGLGSTVMIAGGEGDNCVLSGFTIAGGLAEYGGGVRCGSGTAEISRCVISGNRAVYGGGVSAVGAGSIALVNCILSGNVATYGGGVYGIEGVGITTVNSCTVSGNAAEAGGGIYSRDRKLSTANTILWGNADEGGDDEAAQIDVSGGLISADYCCIEGWSGTLAGEGNFDADPSFAEAGYWDDNSTDSDVSDDMWVAGDYHLRSEYGRWDSIAGDWMHDGLTSVCLDAADPSADWSEEIWPNGKRANIGAYGGTGQASMNGHPCDFDVDGLVNFADLGELARRWDTEGDFIENVTGDQPGAITFDDLQLLCESWLWER